MKCDTYITKIKWQYLENEDFAMKTNMHISCVCPDIKFQLHYWEWLNKSNQIKMCY